MNEEKQISEMAKVIKSSLDDLGSGVFNFTGYEIAVMFAKALYNADYRKIYDDHERQCTCYALGCQMAEELEKKVAKKFIEAVDSMMECVCAMTGLPLTYYGEYAELKKKYEVI